MNLIFIYNANSGILNGIMDAGHKIFNPSTYPCSLCALTYDTFTENEIWQNFRKDSSIRMEFYHKDEFEATFPKVNMIYPAILKLEGNQITTVLTNEILNDISDVDELIERLNSNL